MNSILNEKRLTIINLIIVVFFAIIYLTYYFKIDFVLLGVFREMLFLPFIAAQIPVLIFGMLFLAKEKKFSFFFDFKYSSFSCLHCFNNREFFLVKGKEI
jgi:hypothetical protein